MVVMMLCIIIYTVHRVIKRSNWEIKTTGIITPASTICHKLTVADPLWWRSANYYSLPTGLIEPL